MLGFSAAPGLASVSHHRIIPILGWLLMIGSDLAVADRRDGHRRAAGAGLFDTGKAIIVVLIGLVVNFVVTMVILAPLLGMRMLMG